MLDTMGLIIASNNEAELGELTRLRTACAVPFAGRYRLIDFVLSALVNSGIDNVGVATDHTYQSLLNHLGNGKQWDLARKKDGLLFLPPFRDVDIAGDSRLTMLNNALGFFNRSKQHFVVVCDGTNVCNIRFDEIVKEHKERNADITIVFQKAKEKQAGEHFIDLDEDSRVTSVIQANDKRNCLNRMVGYYVFTKDLLIKIVEECKLQDKTKFIRDVVERNVKKLKIFGHNFEGYLSTVKSVQDFYNISMDLLHFPCRQNLFINDDKILTKSKDRVPTRYLMNSKVKNCMVADGCVIDGTAENSIISRGVKIEKGAVVRDCIIMPDSKIETNANLSCCILDKNVTVRSGKTLVGQKDFPIIVGKGRTI